MIFRVNAIRSEVAIAETARSLAALLLAALVLVRACLGVALAAEGPRSAPVEGSPAAWLWAADKSEEWKAATLRCQELFGRLNFQEPSKTSGCRACRPWPSMDGAMAATAIYSSVAGWLCKAWEPTPDASGASMGTPISRTKSWRNSSQKMEV